MPWVVGGILAIVAVIGAAGIYFLTSSMAASAKLTVTPSHVSSGQAFTVQGSGLPPSTTLVVNIGNLAVGQLTYEPTTDINGNFTVNATGGISQIGNLPIDVYANGMLVASGSIQVS
jgi:hypothetical protein